MIAYNHEVPPTPRVGRPSLYHFSQLYEKSRLIIPLDEGDDSRWFAKSISACLFTWKKREGVTFKTAVRNEINQISVYRL